MGVEICLGRLNLELTVDDERVMPQHNTFTEETQMPRQVNPLMKYYAVTLQDSRILPHSLSLFMDILIQFNVLLILLLYF